ncbi:MAG: sugar transferase [Bryobacterales bacterium]|nr:sugar transferase [Bryobacterales bacterium]
MIGVQQVRFRRVGKPREIPAALRAVDRVLAAVLLAGLLPLLGVIALLIRILSGRSPLVAHVRVGYGGRELKMLKFRTMWPVWRPMAEGAVWIQTVVSEAIQDMKPRQDPRVTSRFARLCRTCSLDELPQLWHVVTGEMSLVGPRPVTRQELDRHYGEQADVVLSVRPGITGLWQVLGRNSLHYRKRRRLDIYLARRYSLRLYAWVLLRTIPRVVSGKGAW